MRVSSEIIAKTEKFGANNYLPLPVVLTKGEGVWVWDLEGRKYLDMLSAYSALSHGHRHPKVVAALKDQADRLTLTSRAFHNDLLGDFYERVAKLTGLPRVLPMNTGAEAVETALKAARKWGYVEKGVKEGKAEIIVCEDNFHGRTISVISFSTEAEYRKDFGPFTPGFKTVEYGNLEALNAAINENTVAFLVEPIQGEAGVRVPPAGYLKKAHELCKANKVLLLADEVQTGFGRTGKMFCSEHEGVLPEVIIMGKALGGGVYPVSAIAATEEVMRGFGPGQHGSTFGGNPLAAAVAIAALDVLVEENLVERAREMGEYLMSGLKEIRSPFIREIRGAGLLIGIDLVPEAGGARRFCEALMTEGMLCKETHESVVRLAPPLIIAREEIDWAIERLQRVLVVN
ncbi:MAG: ornithine--oxo-acid transaminase [Pseudomonadota bacterium]